MTGLQTAAPPAPPAPVPAQPPGRRLLGSLLVVLVAAGAFWATRTSLIDDAYITLSYARNVAFSGTWGALSDVPSATASSPLWVLVLAALTVLTRDAVWALGVASVLVALGQLLVLRALAARTGLPGWVAPAAVVALLLSPLVLSVTGMESGLLVLVLSALALAGAARRPLVFGLLAGAAVLTRTDAAPAVVMLALASPAVLRRLHVAVPAAVLVAGSFMTWSWYHLGTAIPDTFIIKTQQKHFGPYSVGSGWRWYYELYGWDAVWSFVPLALGLLALVVLAALLRRRGRTRVLPWLALTAAGAAHLLTLVLLVVPPYHWYYAPAVGTGLIGLFAAAGALAVRSPALAAPVAALALAQVVGMVATDVDRALPWRVMPIQTNFATSADYDAMGAGLTRALATPHGVQRVMSMGEIGHLDYTCDCVVDGLSDSARVVPGIEEQLRHSSPFLRSLLELDYRHRDFSAAVVPVVGHLQNFPVGEVPPGLPHWPIDLVPGRGETALVLDQAARSS